MKSKLLVSLILVVAMLALASALFGEDDSDSDETYSGPDDDMTSDGDVASFVD